MSDSPRILAFIPARSGSKGVPGKNIKRIKNVPLLNFTAYCTKVCCQQGIFSDYLVSTDSAHYLELSSSFLSPHDYLRPPDLASDVSPTISSVLHGLNWFRESHNKTFDYVVILQPTSPFRTPLHIQDCIEIATSDLSITCVTSVSPLFDHHPLRIKKLCPITQQLEDFLPELFEPEPSRRQDFHPPSYIRNGAIYCTPVSFLEKYHLIRGNNIRGYIMPEASSINIDEHLDFLMATAALDYEPYQNDLEFFRPIISSCP